MTINQKLVQHGTAGGTVINVDVSRIESNAPIKVTLSANYIMSSTPHIPTRPGFTGAPTSSLDYPRTILSGATISLFAGEAAALVAAGKATYA